MSRVSSRNLPEMLEQRCRPADPSGLQWSSPNAALRQPPVGIKTETSFSVVQTSLSHIKAHICLPVFYKVRVVLLHPELTRRTAAKTHCHTLPLSLSLYIYSY